MYQTLFHLNLIIDKWKNELTNEYEIINKISV